MDRSNLVHVAHLGISFFLIFMAYGVAQTYQTSSTFAKDGAFAVAIIYVAFCLSNIFLSSYLLKMLGLKFIFIVSSTTYPLFILANIYFNRWTLFITAFLLGIGAALFWTAQGVFLTLLAKRHEELNNLPPSTTRGFVNGVFFSIYLFHQTAGSVIASILFHFQYPPWIIFTVMAIVAVVGVISFIFLPSIKIEICSGLKNNMCTEFTYFHSSFEFLFLEKRSSLTSLSIIADYPFLFLVPTMCFNGLAQGFLGSAVPPMIVDKSRKFMVFALLGLCNATNSFIFGKLSDLIGKRLIIFSIGGLAFLSIFSLFLTIWNPPFNDNRWEIITAIILCFSTGDTIFTNQLHSIIGSFYQDTRPVDAFASMKVFQAGFIAIGFVEHIYLSIPIQLIILIGFLLVSCVSLIIGHSKVKSLDTVTKINTGLSEDQCQNVQEENSEENVPLRVPASTHEIVKS